MEKDTQLQEAQILIDLKSGLIRINDPHKRRDYIFSYIKKSTPEAMLELFESAAQQGFKWEAEHGIFITLIDQPGLFRQLGKAGYQSFWQKLEASVLLRKQLLILRELSELTPEKIVYLQAVFNVWLQVLTLVDEHISQMGHAPLKMSLLQILAVVWRDKDMDTFKVVFDRDEMPPYSFPVLIKVLEELDFAPSEGGLYELEPAEATIENLAFGAVLRTKKHGSADMSAAAGKLTDAMIQRQAETLLRKIIFAIRALSMYPQGHPGLKNLFEGSLQTINEMMADRKMLVITQLAGTLLVNEIRAKTEDRLLTHFVEVLETRGISSIMFRPGVTPKEFEALIKLFDHGISYISDQGGPRGFLQSQGVEHIILDQYRYGVIGSDEEIVRIGTPGLGLGFGPGFGPGGGHGTGIGHFGGIDPNSNPEDTLIVGASAGGSGDGAGGGGGAGAGGGGGVGAGGGGGAGAGDGYGGGFGGGIGDGYGGGVGDGAGGSGGAGAGDGYGGGYGAGVGGGYGGGYGAGVGLGESAGEGTGVGGYTGGHGSGEGLGPGVGIGGFMSSGGFSTTTDRLIYGTGRSAEILLLNEIASRVSSGGVFTDISNEEIGALFKRILSGEIEQDSEYRQSLAEMIVSLDPGFLQRIIIDSSEVQERLSWSVSRRVIDRTLNKFDSDNIDERLAALETIQPIAELAVLRHKDSSLRKIMDKICEHLEKKETDPDLSQQIAESIGTLIGKIIISGNLTMAQDILTGIRNTADKLALNPSRRFLSFKIDAYDRVFIKTSSQETVSYLIRQLGKETHSIVKRTISLLKMIKTEEVVVSLLAVFETGARRERNRAFDILSANSDLSGTVITHHLSVLSDREMFPRRHDNVREMIDQAFYRVRNALGVLAKIQHQEATAIFRMAARDSDQRIRKETLTVLMHARHPMATEIAKTLLKDPDEDVRNLAILAMREPSGTHIVNDLVQLFLNEPNLRKQIVETLAFIDDRKSKGFLSQSLIMTDNNLKKIFLNDLELQAWTIKCLAEHGDSRDLSTMKSFKSNYSSLYRRLRVFPLRYAFKSKRILKVINKSIIYLEQRIADAEHDALIEKIEEPSTVENRSDFDNPNPV